MQLAALGLSLGIAAGFSPGPLLTLVITSTLERGFGAGARVAVAPLVTDAPIILLALLFLRQLPSSWLSLIGGLGGLVVILLGVDTLSRRDRSVSSQPDTRGSRLDLVKGAVVNLLNPHPWVFWITVQGPILVQGWRRNPTSAVAFLLLFYLAIVGSKITVAWITARGRHGLDRSWYARVLTLCGLLMIVMGGWLLVDASTALLATAGPS